MGQRMEDAASVSSPTTSSSGPATDSQPTPQPSPCPHPAKAAKKSADHRGPYAGSSAGTPTSSSASPSTALPTGPPTSTSTSALLVRDVRGGPGIVYIICPNPDKVEATWVKIGHSRSIGTVAHRYGTPYGGCARAEYWHTDDRRAAERETHRDAAEYWLGGEVFSAACRPVVTQRARERGYEVLTLDMTRRGRNAMTMCHPIHQRQAHPIQCPVVVDHRPDDVSIFLSTTTERAIGKSTQASVLYDAYKKWCTARNRDACTSTAFGRSLKKRGLRKSKRG
jgi:hypothetical protein